MSPYVVGGAAGDGAAEQVFEAGDEILIEYRDTIHIPYRLTHRAQRAGSMYHVPVLFGFFNYHAVPTNSRTLVAFRHHVLDLWRRTLTRRSQKGRTTWERMTRLADDWLPKPHILHPWPNQRFIGKHPRWEPYAGKSHVRFCAGVA